MSQELARPQTRQHTPSPTGGVGDRSRPRVGRQCEGGGHTRGSLIPHARARGSLVIAMIEPSLGTAPMALPRGADRLAAGDGATGGRAVRMAAITGYADGKETVTATAEFLTKRRVHVGAARSDWTRRSNRGTKRRLARSLSEHRGGHRGPGGFSSRSSPQRAATLSLRDVLRSPNPEQEAVDAVTLWTHRTRPQGLQISPRTRDSHSAHSQYLFSEESKTKTQRRRESRFARFQVSANSPEIIRRQLAPFR